MLDPVAVGAISYRTDVVQQLLQYKPTVVRGNASEVTACAGLLGIDADSEPAADKPRGADSTLDSLSVNLSVVDALARATGGVVVMTGAKDYVTDGSGRRALVSHNVPTLQYITAAGCSLSSLIAGFCSTDTQADPFRGAVHACAFFSLAAERASRLPEYSRGPGSHRVGLMDQLANLDAETMAALARIELMPQQE